MQNTSEIPLRVIMHYEIATILCKACEGTLLLGSFLFNQ